MTEAYLYYKLTNEPKGSGELKMKEYIRDEGGWTLYPGVGSPPLLQVNSDYVHRDEIGEIVSSIILKGFQKLQITRLFSILFIIT